MTTCARCGGPTLALFTSLACARDCDRTITVVPPGTFHGQRVRPEDHGLEPIAFDGGAPCDVMCWLEDATPPAGWVRAAIVFGAEGKDVSWIHDKMRLFSPTPAEWSTQPHPYNLVWSGDAYKLLGRVVRYRMNNITGSVVPEIAHGVAYLVPRRAR